ncbi:MAG: hypothetical protein ACXAEU_20380 [Candidatus Hodarchaeales archaeon]
MDSLDIIFANVKGILEKLSAGFKVTGEIINSKAKEKKLAYHLYGTKEVSLFGKKPQLTYIAGVIKQKNYVSFYLSPIYSHPDLLDEISEELRVFLKGKSCFNLNKISNKLLEEMESILLLGIKKYKELEWI